MGKVHPVAGGQLIDVPEFSRISLTWFGPFRSRRSVAPFTGAGVVEKFKKVFFGIRQVVGRHHRIDGAEGPIISVK